MRFDEAMATVVEAAENVNFVIILTNTGSFEPIVDRFNTSMQIHLGQNLCIITSTKRSSALPSKGIIHDLIHSKHQLTSYDMKWDMNGVWHKWLFLLQTMPTENKQTSSRTSNEGCFITDILITHDEVYKIIWNIMYWYVISSLLGGELGSCLVECYFLL